MNIITARTEQRQARDALFADYTDQNAADYTTIALTYSKHRHRALWITGQLLVLAAAGLALYNMIQGFHDNANYPLLGVTLALLLVSVLVHRYNRNRTYDTPDDITATIEAAKHENAPTDALPQQLRLDETGENR
ncbi:hypothetical protein CH267_00060 [Rhodococcus sp. 06-621-2]|nr:hypothetical protein [Rhodococcus sp. 06-621-2]OZC62791.1 hypothetical protein CH267_00060 [Rhodococcus sp. 06-621-2]